MVYTKTEEEILKDDWKRFKDEIDIPKVMGYDPEYRQVEFLRQFRDYMRGSVQGQGFLNSIGQDEDLMRGLFKKIIPDAGSPFRNKIFLAHKLKVPLAPRSISRQLRDTLKTGNVQLFEKKVKSIKGFKNKKQARELKRLSSRIIRKEIKGLNGIARRIKKKSIKKIIKATRKKLEEYK